MYIWSKELETGNATIDSQHKQLVEAINSLLTACGQGKGRDAIRATLVFVQDYTAKHFRDEESLQLRYQYPDYQNHKKYHEAFRQVISGIVAEYDREGATVALVGKVNRNLGDWLINHIKREDVKVAAHIRQSAR